MPVAVTDHVAVFWEKVDKTGQCWLWTASRDAKGYGRIQNPGKRSMMLAHRRSWELHFFPVPPGLCVLHACDTPACVRPDHLMLGTLHANAIDAKQKGRNGRPPRRTHCVNGYAFTPETTYQAKSGSRACKTCARIRNVESKRRVRARLLASA